ncbi:E3 UFM1-protein ligase 1-like protein [Acropora cervicornis]|uniref:E3 UFM1-protein ligase 1-like protein n=1 Tax=Acropora cervicornis TaxID=6130 RepID=A0AAD9QLH2_ACRCE|nr:E3 UFM1-protein ligase 1-like protein [Acropora cervicornis]
MADWEEIKRLAADFQRARIDSETDPFGTYDTTDGKEYLTPQQLEREIKDELFVHGGRINVVDLQQVLICQWRSCDDTLTENYLDQVAEDINDFLQESGQISIAELSKKFTFPTELSIPYILEQSFMVSLSMLDRGVLFTESFVAQQTACIRGTDYLSSLIAEYGFHEKLLYVGINKLCREGRISGSIQGNLFVPGIYSKSQMAWVDEFFKQNEYIEYDALPRLGITEGSQYLKKRFQKYQVKFLPTCCVGESLVNQVEIAPLLPSPCTSGDAARLLQDIFKSSVHSLAHVFCERFTYDARIVLRTQNERLGFHGHGRRGGSDKRESKKEERRKKAAGGVKVEGAEGSGGGGVRGTREQDTEGKKKEKLVRDKKKDRSTKDEGLDDESKSKQNQSELPFMPVEEISEELQKRCPSCSDDFIEEIANYLYSHSEVQSKVNVLWANAKLFDKGIKLFTDDVQVQLSRHLLKTVCADIVNLAVSLLAAEHMITIKDDSAITPEKIRPGVVKLNTTLNGKTTELERRCALQEQLRQEIDPAMALHLVSAVLFQHHTGCSVYLGRCVPQIISFLEDKMSPEHYVGSEDHESTEGQEGKSVTDQLEEGLDNIKKLALELKKAKDTDS